MGLNLRKLFNDVTRNVGRVIDPVVPGNQSNWGAPQRPAPVQRPPVQRVAPMVRPQAPRVTPVMPRVGLVSTGLPTTGDMTQDIIKRAQAIQTPKPVVKPNPIGDFAVNTAKSMVKPFTETADYAIQSAQVGANNALEATGLVKRDSKFAQDTRKARDESYQQSLVRPATRVVQVTNPIALALADYKQQTAAKANQQRVDDLVKQSRQIKNDQLSGKITKTEADKRFADTQKNIGNTPKALDAGTQRLKDIGAIGPDGTEKTGLETGLGAAGDFLTLYTLGRNPLSGAGIKQAAQTAGTSVAKQAAKEIALSNVLNASGQIATGISDRQTAGDIAKDVVTSGALNTALMGAGYGYNALKGGADITQAPKNTTVSGKTDVQKPQVAAKNEVRTVAPDATPDIPVRDGGLKWTQKFSPDRIIRENITQPIEQAVNRGIYKLETSQNPIARGVGKVAQGFSREAGLSPEALQARHSFSGQGQYGKLEGDVTTKLGKDFSPESKTNVYAALDPEQAAVLGIKKPKSLTPEEKVLYDQLDAVRTETTDKLLAAELITPEQASNKSYLKREYSIFMDDPGYQQGLADTKGFLKKRKAGISDEVLDTAVTDPAYLAGKHQAEAQQALAIVDYSNKLAEMGYVSDKPLKGYSQLPNTKLYGSAAGKWVPQSFAEDFTGFQYNSAMMSAVNDVLNAYDSWGVRRAKKELLTIFNPAVRLGNQVSNRAVFSQFGGINPVQFNKEYLGAGKLIKSNSQYYKEAVQQGLMGTDITMADFGKRLMETTGDEGIARKGAQWAEKSYSGADDKAKLTAYKIWRDRGYPPEKAYSLTQRAFQDYRSVGFFYDLAAKTPLIGNAFVRFAGDAVRIAKNNAIDHPIRSAATIAMWANFVNIMSKLSGESAEDKKTREDRFGAPKVPFSDISLTVQTPVGEINLARFMPQYQLNDIGNPLTRVLPIGTSPVSIKDGKPELNPQGLQDPLLGQIAQIAIDKDFRGKSIRDPEQSTDSQGRKRIRGDLSTKDQALNVGRFLGTQNIPLGREADTIISAATGNKDIYGKERSLPQAIARSAGIKVEQFGAKQAEDQRGKNAFFDEQKAIEEELKGKSPEVQEAYRRATGYYKTRDEVDNEFAPGQKRKVKAPVYNFSEDKWRDFAKNPEVYDMMLKKKEQEAKKGAPLQPQFDKTLSADFRKQLIQNKAMAPGDDVEADERMYSSSEWDTYQKLQKTYEEKAKAYYPGGDFKDELVKHQPKEFPKKGAAKTAYDEAYNKFREGKGAKPAFSDAVAADKDAYTEAKRNWTNEERKVRGLAPISKEMWNNVTFGYESDEEKVYKELKYGKGFGSYGKSGGRKGSGGSKGEKVSDPNKYAISTKAKVYKPGKVSAKAPTLAKVTIKNQGLTKAKVASKKSRV